MKYNTTIDVKRKYWPVFAEFISNQFEHGGDKYALEGFDDREATDVISSVFGGKSEFNWILGTMIKYVFRFKNLEREKDLFKIATYCYILWLKQGNHLNTVHEEDVDKHLQEKEAYEEKVNAAYGEDCGPECQTCL